MRQRISLKKMALEAKKASVRMAQASTSQKNAALETLTKSLKRYQDDILTANLKDISLARSAGLTESLIDRLSLQGRLQVMVKEMQDVIRLPDPIGEIFDRQKLPNHLKVYKQRTPLGVLGIIYESRPNVTIDVAALTIKSGNSAILRGGSETLNTNQLLVQAIQSSLAAVDLPSSAIQLLPSTDRLQVKKLLHLHEYIDLIIPRGGSTLHRFCRENSTIPVVTGGIGICHLFVDESANQKRSLEVIANAKIQRPTVCNALDTLLVHEKIAPTFVPEVVSLLKKKKVSFRLDPVALALIPQKDQLHCRPALSEDWNTEWLSLILGIRVVNNIHEAIAHIRQHSTGHSDGILTQDKKNIDYFVKQVDSAAVYVNASTRFTDGGQLGLGAEVAISTQKIHARGPMGLKELTSYKWVVEGNYETRK